MCGPNCKCSKHTDTPRTDASKVDKVGMTFVWVEFAQQLERELAASQAEVTELAQRLRDESARWDNLDDKCEKLETEVERLKEQYESAAESVARMHEAAVGEIRGPSISVLDDIKAVRERAEKAEAEVERLKNDFNQLKTLMHQTIWFVDDMIKTHTNGCEDCHKKHGAMIALFKDIAEEPQWPIDPTNK